MVIPFGAAFQATIAFIAIEGMIGLQRVECEDLPLKTLLNSGRPGYSSLKS